MPHLKSPNNVDWHYDVAGQGEYLLFVHGWATDGRVWNQQMEYFQDFYRVVAVDLPGHGQSSWTDMTFADMAEGLDFFLNTLGASQVNLIASSFGGLVALKYFEMFPKKIRRLILIGAGPRFAKSREFPYGLAIPRIRKLREQVETDFPKILNIFFRSLFTVQERESLRFKWLQIFQQGQQLPNQGALIKFLRIIEKEDLTKVFKSIAMPVYLLSGTQDYICPPEALKYFQFLLPKARIEFFEDCGHFPFLSKPQEFNKKVKNFISERK